MLALSSFLFGSVFHIHGGGAEVETIRVSNIRPDQLYGSLRRGAEPYTTVTAEAVFIPDVDGVEGRDFSNYCDATTWPNYQATTGKIAVLSMFQFFVCADSCATSC